MFNHAPVNYSCPLCDLVKHVENGLNRTDDIVLQNASVTASIAPKWWINNPGHVLVMPNEHFENIYDIPPDIFAEVYKLTQRIAIAMRHSYGCNGISTRQHNEPAGDQDLWHLHVHVYPRYSGDNLYGNHDKTRIAAPSETKTFADKLKNALR